MTNKLFDSFVNDKLKDYESPVPDGLWEKIIAKERKTKNCFLVEQEDMDAWFCSVYIYIWLWISYTQ